MLGADLVELLEQRNLGVLVLNHRLNYEIGVLEILNFGRGLDTAHDAVAFVGLETAALDAVKYPADAKYTGDWRAGERIAQSGVGMQFSDAPNTVGGGNCYACHQLTKAELAYGNIGPSLYNYGKLRGNAEATVKYTWARLWNPHAFNACNNMPRFGAAGILNDAQLKDLMALLLDPESPVNK